MLGGNIVFCVCEKMFNVNEGCLVVVGFRRIPEIFLYEGVMILAGVAALLGEQPGFFFSLPV